MGILVTIGKVIDLILFILKWKRVKDEAVEKERAAISEEAKKALVSRDVKHIDRVWSKLRT